VAISGATLEPQAQAHVSDECRTADHLAIVLVHGVGYQQQGETLLAWSGRLIRMLAARYSGDRPTPPDLVHQSTIDLDGGKLSLIEVRIPGRDGRPAQHWRVTEAFWAASIQPPSVGTVLRWLGARGAAALAAPGAAVVRNSVYASGVVIGLLVVYAAVRTAVSIIPSDKVRNALIVPLDRALTEWSGDMHVLLFDPAQSANIRTRIMEAISGAAEGRFEKVALIAHSGGAVASYLTLTDEVLWASAPSRPDVVTLITHGQGLNIAWRLCNLSNGADCGREVDTARRLTADLKAVHPGLRWYDYYSEGDIVSEGPLSPPKCLEQVVPAAPDSIHTENVPSDPHGTFWDNDEEFLLPIVERLEAAAREAEPNPRPFPRPRTDWCDKRMFRIGMYSFTSRVISSAMLAAIVGSALLGGARMDDIGAAIASFVKDVPVLNVLAAPPEWLKAAHDDPWWSWWPGISSALMVSLLLVLAAVFPLTRLGPEKLAWTKARSPLQRFLVQAIDYTAAALPMVPLAVWAFFGLREGGDQYPPAWAVILALVFVAAGILGVLRRFPSGRAPNVPDLSGLQSAARNGLINMAILAVVAGLGVGTLLAIVGDADYGGMRLGAGALGAIVVWLLYRLVGGVAHWRWQAWDDQEREQFRQVQDTSVATPSPRNWGVGFDLLSISFACVAAVILAAAVGGPMISGDVAITGGVVALGLIVLVWLIGSSQDAANSASGVRPGEVKQLPQSA
jgi:hypothetical protein